MKSHPSVAENEELGESLGLASRSLNPWGRITMSIVSFFSGEEKSILIEKREVLPWSNTLNFIRWLANFTNPLNNKKKIKNFERYCTYRERISVLTGIFVVRTRFSTSMSLETFYTPVEYVIYITVHGFGDDSTIYIHITEIPGVPSCFVF